MTSNLLVKSAEKVSLACSWSSPFVSMYSIITLVSMATLVNWDTQVSKESLCFVACDFCFT